MYSPATDNMMMDEGVSSDEYKYDYLGVTRLTASQKIRGVYWTKEKVEFAAKMVVAEFKLGILGQFGRRWSLLCEENAFWNLGMEGLR